MTRLCQLLLASAVVAVAGGGPRAAAPQAPAAKKPKVEVVFCLDTTGSMGGLIDGAKAKIWSICNQIAGGKPTPELKVGLVAYRDKGDKYVTQVTDLTDDLDDIHGKLKQYTADGGGDTPEHVNQALYDAVHKVGWSKEKKTLRIIFLVGDAPPHMDYKDDVKYPATCKVAVERGIIINTIQCGNDAECTKYWRDIAVKSEGSYAAIPQTGGVVAVATPYDARLAELNRTLARSTVAYGAAPARKATAKKAKAAEALPAGAAADRAGFGGKSGGRGVKGDLVDDVKDKKVDLKKLKDAELPDELRKLKTVEEREAYLKKVEEQRRKLNAEVVDLDRKRAAHIKQELEKRKDGGRDSFDNHVLQMLRKQAEKFDIKY